MKANINLNPVVARGPDAISSLRFLSNGDPEFPVGIFVPRFATLRFILEAGSPLCTRSPRVLTNYPDAGPFAREVFHELQRASVSVDGDWFCDIDICTAGSFDYYLTWSNLNTSERAKGNVGHFVVDPILKVNNRVLPPQAISLQTHLTKCLGPLTNWEKHFKLSSSLGYNAIHLSPVQELGGSNSAYSIRNHLAISPNLFPNENLSNRERFQRLSDELIKLEKKYNLLMIGDVVWNHTAGDSPWLSEHPEATYNIHNQPHLKPACLVDIALQQFSVDIINGKYRDRGLTAEINSEAHITTICELLKNVILPRLRLWEFFVVHVDDTVEEFRQAIKQTPSRDVEVQDEATIQHILKTEGVYHHPLRDRFCTKIKLETALKLFHVPKVESLNDNEIQKRCGMYRRALDLLNLGLYHEVDDHLRTIVSRVAEHIRYHRLSEYGPKRGPLTLSSPLVEPYFRRLETTKYIEQAHTSDKYIDKSDPFHEEGVTYCAHNGWIWGGSSLVDFAGPQFKYYLRREVIIWGDCVKLRYGESPADVPWLWAYMKEYTQQMATLFHGLRVDNAHSTPIHVARYLIDAAREIRPELYVTAELFTGNEEHDRMYISKLGINSLIREAMQAGDPWELGRLVHRYGGDPVGSVTKAYPYSYYNLSDDGDDKRIVLPLKPRIPPALFMDCTHDNEVPAQKRSALDTLPNTALVSMARCAIGSTRGYDSLIPSRIDLVTETRQYEILDFLSESFSKKSQGIFVARKFFNDLHTKLELEGYTEIHVHQQENVITVQRHNPRNHKAVYAICHTAFYGRGETPNFPIKIPNKISKILFYAKLEMKKKKFVPSPTYITGLGSKLIFQTHHCEELVEIRENRSGAEKYVDIWFKFNFPPGTVLVLETILEEKEREALTLLSKIDDDRGLKRCFTTLQNVDFNYLFYLCEPEERAVTDGRDGTYYIPNYGATVFAGIQGFVTILQKIREKNDMGHPFFDHLRTGNWPMDYIKYRLRRYAEQNKSDKFNALLRWLEEYFDAVQKMPRYLIPKYFDKVVMKLYLSGVHYVVTELMDHSRVTIQPSMSEFMTHLILTSVQFVAAFRNYPLIAPELVAEGEFPETLAAGLPYFCAGHMRVWGRDTFISLRGLLLYNGRFKEAQNIILGFASTMRHGLIPNLLDQGRNPRYNSRDAVWWWLAAVQDYCKLSPEGVNFLQTPVIRIFPTDDHIHNGQKSYVTMKLSQVVFETLSRHAAGIYFRERNAGPQLDNKMKPEGFDIQITVDIETSFIFGGNQYNCGTWMDKMGESYRAGNFGTPATPRDGAAIEIVALLKYTLKWVKSLSEEHPTLFPYKGVEVLNRNHNTLVFFSWKDWEDKLQMNFEKYFWIPLNPQDDGRYVINKNVVHRRGIYKDVYGSSIPWHDYQLRPNQCIAMALAPELFDAEHARTALTLIEKTLLAPLGMRTLDPQDLRFRPNYDNSVDSDDYLTSKGFNYHQGPEWVWLFGYFLRAKLKFSNLSMPSAQQRIELANEIRKLLVPHRQAIAESPWCSLPELTNANGAFCRDGCPSQAWSVASIIDAIDELEHYLSETTGNLPLASSSDNNETKDENEA